MNSVLRSRCLRTLLALIPLVSITATEYYVSPTGADTNVGSRESPFQTIDRINSLDLEPGDKVLFEAGKTFNGTLSLTNEDYGSQEQNIVVASYGHGCATISSGALSGAKAVGTRHITIQDLVFVGSGIKEGHQNSGLDIVDSQNVTLLRLDAQGYTKSGIGLFNTNYWSVTYCNAFNNGFAGISVSNKDWKDQLKWNRNGYIAFTNTYNNSGDPNIRNNHSGNGIVIGQMIDLVIEYCRSYDNGWNMAWTGNGPVGIWTWCVDNALIQYCIAHDNKTRGKDGGGFDFDGGTPTR